MSSLFGALSTAVSGLSAQSSAFSNISDNVANSQTTGFKGTDTNFADYLTNSTAVVNDSGFVATRPDYRNDVQGTIAASNNALGLAISGNGFFQVSQVTNNTTGTPALSTVAEYTRDGNFKLDSSGYLVNDVGKALNGWTADPVTQAINENQAAPIKIDQTTFSPVPTSSVSLSANLPAGVTGATAALNPTQATSTVNVYDATGTEHTVALTWTATTTTNQWNVALTSADSTPSALGTATVTFGSAGAAAGTIGTLTAAGGVTASTNTLGSPAGLSFSATYGGVAQPISIGLGDFGKANGVTQYAGAQYTLGGISQNGIPPGNFSSVTLESSGNVIANYNNGQTRIVARVPLVSFANADGLQRQNGQAFTVTEESGNPLANNAGSGGTGQIVTSALEGSNVDIATEFTKLIVAQQAYAANTKMVTTANTLLQQTIDMKQ